MAEPVSQAQPPPQPPLSVREGLVKGLEEAFPAEIFHESGLPDFAGTPEAPPVTPPPLPPPVPPPPPTATAPPKPVTPPPPEATPPAAPEPAEPPVTREQELLFRKERDLFLREQKIKEAEAAAAGRVRTAIHDERAKIRAAMLRNPREALQSLEVPEDQYNTVADGMHLDQLGNDAPPELRLAIAVKRLELENAKLRAQQEETVKTVDERLQAMDGAQRLRWYQNSLHATAAQVISAAPDRFPHVAAALGHDASGTVNALVDVARGYASEHQQVLQPAKAVEMLEENLKAVIAPYAPIYRQPVQAPPSPKQPATPPAPRETLSPATHPQVTTPPRGESDLERRLRLAREIENKWAAGELPRPGE